MASMRPRSFERGRYEAQQQYKETGISFNEAALFRTRKEGFTHAHRTNNLRFNEAALFRTRKALTAIYMCVRLR